MAGEYFNPMDKEFNANVEQIGASTNPFQHQTEALKARIFHGASSIEFSFFGAGKTNKEQPGPESFGRAERADMRALAEINKVKTSTHATVSINGLSGYNQQQGGFSSEAQDRSFIELQKAIDFASEASTGGAVVFHTGESPRSMWSNFDKKFKLHNNEDKEEIHYLVDPEEKKIIGGVKEDAHMFIPVEERDANGNIKYITDEKGKLVTDEITSKPIPIFKMTELGDIETKKIKFSDYRKEQEEKLKKQGLNPDAKENRQNVVKSFFEKQQEFQIQYALGQARQYLTHYRESVKNRDKLTDALKYYSKLKDEIPSEEWENNFVKQPQADFIIPDKVDPVEYLQQKLKDNVLEIGYGKEIALSGIRQAQESYDKVKNAVFVEDFAKREATDKMAEAALYAWRKTQDRIKAGDELIKKNPLYISPESWRPDDYGGHPEEMAELVRTARAKVADKLKGQFGESKAKQIAEQSIRATLDVGHMNTWRRHFVRKDGESEEKFDKRFNTWVLEESKKLAKEGIVGHVHLSDNYGYDDEHLAIGQGNAPVKEFVKIMRENGVTDFIAEAGSFNAMTALPDAWSELGSSIYRVGAKASDSSLDAWGNVHQGYFGRTEGPRYVIGDYSPSDDFKGSPFYSGTPLE